MNYTQNQDTLRGIYGKNDELIVALTKGLSAEIGTGYGAKSEAVMAEIRALRTEQENLLELIAENSDSAENVTDVFLAMSGVTGFSANVLKVTSFGALIFFVYIGLVMLNPMGTNLVTAVTPEEIGVTDSRPRCPICGKILKNPQQKYCCNRCKQRAYRERKEDGAA